MKIDALSVVLDTLHFRGGGFSRPILRPPWSVRFDLEQMFDHGRSTQVVAAIFHTVLQGSTLIEIGGKWSELHAGDVIFLKRAQAHTLASEKGLIPLPFPKLFTEEALEMLRRFEANEGPKTEMISGVVWYPKQPSIHPTLSALPDVILLDRDSSSRLDEIDQVLRFLSKECGSNRVASHVLMARLADVLFVQVIRASIEMELISSPSWLSGLRDGRIGSALTVIHSSPQKSWSVETLARHVGMSRTNFTRQFGALVGEPPLTYLTRWRMHRAAKALLDSDEALASIAESVGYRSESAFSRTFSRFVGTAPATFRRQKN